ncbi:hypothetical protein ACFL1X_12990, partial [Candidatus Hydrogenedentota bacterium]
LIDRSQASWTKRYILNENPGPKRPGALIGIGATKGERLFDGLELEVKYFFDCFNVELVDKQHVRGVEERGAILEHPEELQRAKEIGRRLCEESRSREISS